MRWQKGKAKRSFNRAARFGRGQRSRASGVPRMIREDRPLARPIPPGFGAGVDAQHFNQRWSQELAAHRSHGNTKSKTPSRDPMTQQFKRAADPLDQITDKARDRGLER